MASSRKASSVRRRYIEESAKRRALNAKLKLFEEQQALAERKFQLQQQEKKLKIKSDPIQIAAKEQVYAEADALERGSTSELDPKSQKQEQLKLNVRGSTLWSLGGLLHLCPAVNKECINHKPV